jgi:hypothetical protein
MTDVARKSGSLGALGFQRQNTRMVLSSVFLSFFFFGFHLRRKLTIVGLVFDNRVLRPAFGTRFGKILLKRLPKVAVSPALRRSVCNTAGKTALKKV